MLLGIVLLYVGAVLCINGIWLIGQASAAEAAEVAPDRESAPDVSASVGGRGRQAALARAEASPLYIENREVTVINLFTGFVGVVVAVTYIVQGNAHSDLASARSGGFILLFAFTYLWVTINQWLNAGGRGFGWYCLFVAITAVPAGIYTLNHAAGNTGSVWLGLNWFVWAILWFMFFVLLALGRPIARITGLFTVFVGIATSWILGFGVLIGSWHF